MESVLKKYFGYSLFRPNQKEIIEEILRGRDSLVVMATGSGKSLCYQIPSLILRKTAVVVSPLLALMQDQVMSLKQRGIKAEYMGSSQTDSSVYGNAESGQFDIVYMTPERACSLPSRFWSNLSNVGICLLAIDEAHCISEWGHDFRKEYRQLGKLRGILLDVPVVALTATATEKVQLDIINSLDMKDPFIAIGSFDRPNLFYGVKCCGRGLLLVDELVGEISKHVASSDSTIVYCTTVKDAEQIFMSLNKAGIKAGIYHGQMANKAREQSHRSFIRDELLVMVATVAFGMGVDKSNIRCVIHYGCPKSVENYYQESGRCGRDGLASICWLYYSRSDFTKVDFYCGEAQTANHKQAIMDSLRAAEHYCSSVTCRRKFLLDYFGESVAANNCGSCDNCTNSKMERDMSREAYFLLSSVRSCGGRWGLNMPINILRGSRSKKVRDFQFEKLPLHGLGKDHSSNWWKALADQLIAHGYLTETFSDIYKYVSVSEKGVQFLKTATPDRQQPLVLAVTSEMVEGEEHMSGSDKPAWDLQNLSGPEWKGFSEAEAKLFRMLLDMRMKLARRSGTAPYAICSDQTIQNIASTRPSSKARLANIDGVNQHFLTIYGDYILENIRHLSQGLDLSLDGKASVQATIREKVYPVPNCQRKLTPAKFEAWKMWNENDLCFQEIANAPGRPAPIKEQTIIGYLLDAAQEGFEINWTRFCVEIGLTQMLYLEIQDAISKVGSREKLNPIKNELPEHVSYVLIKACLTIQDLGISKDVIPSDLQSSKSCEVHPRTSESLQNLNCENHPEGPHLSEASIYDMGANSTLNGNALCPHTVSSPKILAGIKQPRLDDVQIPTWKFQKTDVPEEGSKIAVEATKGSVLEWLTNHDGVALSDITKHFNESEESVMDLLRCLESEFLVFKKNNLYRIM
ncbi:ATP-dependent DNA helicase RecQ-like [Telopea speciosissima]|uniref:ATP-dependent DNA helicase RecQ-like n=1 Tax=Telopea speciosissima TaxID=54955 RepID=UPI001CC6374F|nr:ATP-dependent DNA helicase RecQ-like [Telopea speciosissima]